jgi:transposase
MMLRHNDSGSQSVLRASTESSKLWFIFGKTHRATMEVSDTLPDDIDALRALLLAERASRAAVVAERDNLAAHKVPGIRQAIEAAGATLCYLPQYSPDLNPIEMPFSKFKAFLRKVAERTVSGLYRRIRSFHRGLSAREAFNYFRHAGYAYK